MKKNKTAYLVTGIGIIEEVKFIETRKKQVPRNRDFYDWRNKEVEVFIIEKTNTDKLTCQREVKPKDLFQTKDEAKKESRLRVLEDRVKTVEMQFEHDDKTLKEKKRFKRMDRIGSFIIIVLVGLYLIDLKFLLLPYF